MELLKRENVQICEKADDWRDAIRISVLPLENGGYAEPRYKEEIIKNLEKLGPYIIIADDVALPHARPEQGAIQTQMAVTLFRQAVAFGGEDATARLFISLAANDSESHLNALMQMSDLLGDEAVLNDILTAETEDELFNYFG